MEKNLKILDYFNGETVFGFVYNKKCNYSETCEWLFLFEMNFPFILSKSDFTLYSHINTLCLFEERILLHTLNLRSPCFTLPSSGTSAVFYHAQPSFSICVCLLFHLESLSHICPNSGFSTKCFPSFICYIKGLSDLSTPEGGICLFIDSKAYFWHLK